MKIGIFGGSFNPLHHGHIIMGDYITQQLNLVDEIWYLVSPQNPLKTDIELLPKEHRLSMLEIGLLYYHRLVASDFEFGLPQPSYTENTLKALKETHPNDEFSLVIGADNWALFDKWKNYKNILQEFEVIITQRKGYELRKSMDEKFLDGVNCKNICLADTPIIEISSTNIRHMSQLGQDYRAYVPMEVYKYIRNNQLNL